MNVFSDARVGLVQRALDGLAQREQAIAGNIANVDTPGYHRRDVDFEATLRASLSGTGNGDLSAAPPSLLQTQASPVPGRSHNQRNDGNDVDIDYEMSELAETQLRYSLLTQAASSRFNVLRDIIGKPA